MAEKRYGYYRPRITADYYYEITGNFAGGRFTYVADIRRITRMVLPMKGHHGRRCVTALWP